MRLLGNFTVPLCEDILHKASLLQKFNLDEAGGRNMMQAAKTQADSVRLIFHLLKTSEYLLFSPRKGNLSPLGWTKHISWGLSEMEVMGFELVNPAHLGDPFFLTVVELLASRSASEDARWVASFLLFVCGGFP